jgi:hypothetical protein
MTSVRVYTLLTPGQKAELADLAIKQDRSSSYLIARAIDRFLPGIAVTGAVKHTRATATEKVFARTSDKVAESIKVKASRIDCHDWQIVNACVENFLELSN